jgi:hypothetical protein
MFRYVELLTTGKTNRWLMNVPTVSTRRNVRNKFSTFNWWKIMLKKPRSRAGHKTPGNINENLPTKDKTNPCSKIIFVLF